MKLNLVPARTGVEWVRLGLKNFWRQPLAFVSLFLMFMALITSISQLPLIGRFIPFVLLPFSTLGFMVAASVADASATNTDLPGDAVGVKKPTGALMFLSVARAMRTEWRALAVLGVISAVYCFLTVFLTALVDGGQFMRSYLLGETPTKEVLESSRFQMANLLQMCLALPLVAAMWHAPALVHWHRVEPVKSIFFSLVAMFRNFGAYALYWLAWCGVLVLGLLAAALVGTIVIGVGSLGSDTGAMAIGNILMVGTVLTLAAMAQASNWFTFRDTFNPD
ncbi:MULTISPECIES: BPSS1780 family membrane protein [Variovorax]|uniref:BPSS1780 family membrane protein n=1 Tax=Variovorax TaxID=34072 RepID=UPI0021AC97DD|nr:BPSS1780 family membrane protein [Variovorax paradoxus]UVH55720.1 BPSS1780 family membrane protein [Variovorax paradoxus]